MTRICLGIDFGEVRVGIAISDPSGTIALPRVTLPATKDLLDRVAALAETEKVAEIAVGWPRRRDGSEGPQALRCRAFAEALARRTGLPVHLEDERFTSREMESAFQAGIAKKGKRAKARKDGTLDQASAALILRRYLERPPHAAAAHLDRPTTAE